MKTLYEIAYLENGEIIRGGIKADIRTVGKWIEENKDFGIQFAIPANEDAISIEEYKKEYQAV